MSRPNRDIVYLRDMLECIDDVLDFTASGREKFLADKMRRAAVARSLEVLGEAAKRVSQAARDAHPAVPWKDVAGLRDKLIHDYGQVDFPRLWGIIEGHLPRLRQELELMLREKQA